MDQWLGFVEQNLKPPTVKRYREAVRIYITPELGSKKLHKLDALTIQQMYADKARGGLSASTVNLVHAVLSSSLGRAVKWQLLNTNIMTNVDAPRIPHKEIEVQPYRSTGVALSSHTEALYSLVDTCLKHWRTWWGTAW
jgi:site-specific recombinase XerC